MSKTGKPLLLASSRIADAGKLKSLIDSALGQRSGMSITFTDSTIGVSLDSRGDWTISIGLSLKSDRFRVISAGLEGLGFFQAIENQGTSYFLWTSVLTMMENPRSATERVLSLAIRIVQGRPVSQYIS